MRKLLLAAAATAAIASPAVARDGSGYVGVDLGATLVEDTKLDFDDDVIRINNAIAPDYNTGWDVGLVGGYDFGLIRAELDLEISYLTGECRLRDAQASRRPRDPVPPAQLEAPRAAGLVCPPRRGRSPSRSLIVNTPVPLVDLVLQHEQVREEVTAGIADVMARGGFIGGVSALMLAMFAAALFNADARYRRERHRKEDRFKQWKAREHRERVNR